MRALAATLAFALAIAGTVAAQREPPTASRGPLRTVNAYPVLLPFIALSAEPASALPPGRFEITTRTVYGNSFHWDPFVLYPDLYVRLDMEVMRLSLDIDYGLPAGLTVGVGVALVTQYGGFADPAIQAFHSFFDLPNGDREKVPDNGYRFSVVRSGQAMVEITDPGSSLGDTTVRLKWSVLDAPSRPLSLALHAALKLPTGSVDRFTGSGACDAAVGLLLTQKLGAAAIHGGFRYAYLGAPDWPTVLGFNPHVISFYLGLEQAVSRRLSLNLQTDGTTTPYTQGHPWMGPLSGGFEVGFHLSLSRGSILEVYVVEDYPRHAALDIAAGIGLITRP